MDTVILSLDSSNCFLNAHRVLVLSFRSFVNKLLAAYHKGIVSIFFHAKVFTFFQIFKNCIYLLEDFACEIKETNIKFWCCRTCYFLCSDRII